MAVDRDGRWKLTCRFTFNDLRAWMRDSSTPCFEHLRNLENIPVAPERTSDILHHWGLDYGPDVDLRGPVEGRVHQCSDGETVETTSIRLRVFVQHLLRVREAGTREPDSYALGAIAPRQAEGEGELRPHPPVSEPPWPGMCQKGRRGRFLAPWGMRS